MTAFASVVIDVDSTLCGVEGIDFLAERRGEAVRQEVIALTDQAMNGRIALEAVYGHRLRIIQPSRTDIAALTSAYRNSVAPGAAKSLRAVRAAGARVALVSGGIREAILPLARELGFGNDELYAVSIRFDENGTYAGFDETSPLATQRGKPELVTRLVHSGALQRPILAVGDGATDAMLVGVADTFAAYTGFARRPSVVAAAQLEVASFSELEQFVTGG